MLTAMLLAFGVTAASGNILVDTGADVVFNVQQATGDITSIKYKGRELQSPSGKHSHIASGIGAATTYKVSSSTIVLSATAGDLTHYYVVRKGYNDIYMATYAPTLLPVGELRYIARLSNAQLPTSLTPDAAEGTVIEGQDVYLNSNGKTGSKFYSGRRSIDSTWHGATGSGVGAFMVSGNRETSSGGPFFKDIETQTSVDTKEIYNYMYSGHTQTEAYRKGLHGPYALVFTAGGNPPKVDFTFMETLGLKGWFTKAARGSVTGKASGVAAGDATTVSFSNGGAQYWSKVDSSNNYGISGVKPGTYTLTLFKDELEVATKSVNVTAGNNTATNIASAETAPATIWQIGTFDGTPQGFRNADKLATMHPSDKRMSDWGPLTFAVNSSLTGFPAVQFKDAAVNQPTKITFGLLAADVKAHTLKLAITLSQFGARPVISIGSYTSATPAAPIGQPDSRGLTRGTYRGGNTTFSYDIPASAFKAGTNTLTINPVSGQTGAMYLSPAFVYDAISLLK